jgi:hypothetical protein
MDREYGTEGVAVEESAGVSKDVVFLIKLTVLCAVGGRAVGM